MFLRSPRALGLAAALALAAPALAAIPGATAATDAADQGGRSRFDLAVGAQEGHRLRVPEQDLDRPRPARHRGGCTVRALVAPAVVRRPDPDRLAHVRRRRRRCRPARWTTFSGLDGFLTIEIDPRGPAEPVKLNRNACLNGYSERVRPGRAAALAVPRRVLVQRLQPRLGPGRAGGLGDADPEPGPAAADRRGQVRRDRTDRTDVRRRSSASPRRRRPGRSSSTVLGEDGGCCEGEPPHGTGRRRTSPPRRRRPARRAAPTTTARCPTCARCRRGASTWPRTATTCGSPPRSGTPATARSSSTASGTRTRTR